MVRGARCSSEEGKIRAGFDSAEFELVEIAIARGGTTPPKIMRKIEEEAPEDINGYGSSAWDWYLVGREAAAAISGSIRSSCGSWTRSAGASVRSTATSTTTWDGDRFIWRFDKPRDTSIMRLL